MTIDGERRRGAEEIYFRCVAKSAISGNNDRTRKEAGGNRSDRRPCGQCGIETEIESRHGTRSGNDSETTHRPGTAARQEHGVPAGRIRLRPRHGNVTSGPIAIGCRASTVCCALRPMGSFCAISAAATAPSSTAHGSWRKLPSRTAISFRLGRWSLRWCWKTLPAKARPATTRNASPLTNSADTAVRAPTPPKGKPRRTQSHPRRRGKKWPRINPHLRSVGGISIPHPRQIAFGNGRSSCPLRLLERPAIQRRAGPRVPQGTTRSCPAPRAARAGAAGECLPWDRQTVTDHRTPPLSRQRRTTAHS